MRILSYVIAIFAVTNTLKFALDDYFKARNKEYLLNKIIRALQILLFALLLIHKIKRQFFPKKGKQSNKINPLNN